MDKQDKTFNESLENLKIKVEPGTSQPPVLQRLPSLKPPRDLTLSAYQNIKNPNTSKKNKIYVPNFNVQRKKPSDSATSKPQEEAVKPKLPEKNERVRNHGKKNFVQLDQGVFAQGIPGQKNAGRGSGSSGSSSKDNVLKKPVLNYRTPVKVDKAEEENTLKQLLQDDFVDDPSLEPNYNDCPIVLPFSNDVKSFVKKGEDAKCNTKPVPFQSVKEALDSAQDNASLIYFQLPKSFPGMKAGGETKGNSKPSTSTEQPTENQPSAEQCPLSSLPQGQIGKLQILKSGRARLVFGDVKMWVDMGIPPSCKQDAVSIVLDDETLTGDMYNLGSLAMRMVVTPDLDSLLAPAEPTSTSASKPNPLQL